MLTVHILVVAAAAYGAFCGFVYLVQQRIVYLHWVISFKPTVQQLAGARELRFRCGDASITTWTLHQERRPALLYFGGSSEDVRINLAAFDTLFADRAVYLVCYRGYPGSTGRPSEPQLIADAEVIFDSLAARHERIAVIGKSLGSGIASALAARRRMEKLLLITPYDSLANVAADCLPFLPARWLLRDGYHSVPHLRQIRAPVLVVLAENDELVRKERSDAVIAAIPAACRHIRIIQGAAHTNLRSFASYGQSLKEFVQDDTPAPAWAWEADASAADAGNAPDGSPELDTGAASPS